MTNGKLQELLHRKEKGSMSIETIVCPDGFKVSVQASRFHYCTPREDNPDVWDEVELGFPSEFVPEWEEYAECNDYTNTVYPYVPVSVVVAVLVQHGWGKERKFTPEEEVVYLKEALKTIDTMIGCGAGVEEIRRLIKTILTGESK